MQPRPKYTWFAYFDIDESVRPEWYDEAVRTGRFLASLVSCGHPAVEFQMEEINTYNGVRHVPTRAKYKPITAKFHDDTPSFVTRLLKTYRAHYHASGSATSHADFGDGLPGTSGERASEIDSIGMKVREQRNFFREIILFDLGTSPNSVNVYRLINPIITSIDHEILDYSDRNGQVDITCSISYEGFYEEIGKSVSDYQDALAQLGESGGSGPLQLGSFSDDGDIFSQILGNLGNALPSILASSFNNGSFNLEGLKTSLLSAISSGTPLQNVRNAVRTVDLLKGAGDQLDLIGVVGLTERLASIGLPFSPGNFLSQDRDAVVSAADMMRNLKIGNVAWIDLLD